MLFVFAGLVLAIGASNASPVTGVHNLEGSWISDCQPIGKGGRHGVVTRITITVDRIRAEAQIFATSACQIPTFKVSYSGNAFIRRAGADSFILDHTVASLTLTPQVEEVVAQYNQEGDHGCGLKGWEVAVPKSVAGRRCDPFDFPNVGTTLFDAVWIDNGNLRFGAIPMDFNNIAADKRPAQPLPVVFRKSDN